MRRALRWIFVLAVLLGVLAVWQRDRLVRLHAVNTLFSEERIVANFTGMETLFETAPVPRGPGPVLALPEGPALALPAGFDPWLTRRAVMGIVVLRDGARRHESYHKGTGPQDRFISWSMAKSYISALIGILLEDGTLESLDLVVSDIVPELAGSAYDGVTLRDVLRMSSGVAFDEDYLDFWSDINRMGRVLALGRSMDAFASGLRETVEAPGASWRYVSIDTHVLGMVLREVTGRPVPGLLAERLVAPLGHEADGYYITDGHGTAFVLGGLNLVLRDYARLGLLYARDGRIGDRRIVPRDWVRASTTPQAPTAPGALRYGYQWWIPADARPGEFLARGVYGQYVYVDALRDVVVAVSAADREFREPDAFDDSLQMFRRLSDAAMAEGE